MARRVGRLNIELIARTAAFRAGMKKARKQMGRFQHRTKVLNSLMRKLVALFAVRQIINWGRAQAKAVDTLAKLSDRIGESTERLAGLQHAANITGAGAERMAAGIDVLQKRLGEAAMGTGEARAALDILGLSVKELLALSPAEQFSRIADRVKGLSTQAEKAAVTSKLFSRANQVLVNTLELGSGGLNKMQREAESLGLAISRDAAAQVEAMNDSVTRLKGSLAGLGRELLVSVSPALERFADDARETIGLIKDMTAVEKESTDAAIRKYRQLTAEMEATIAAGVPTAWKTFGEITAAQAELASNALVVFNMKWRKFQAEQAELFVRKPPADINTGNEETLARYERFQNQLTKAAERGKVARDKLVQHQIKGAQSWMSALTSLTSINANESKKQFELHKKASIAEALVNTAAGITRAFRELGPFAWPQVAAIGASGIAQIAQIRSTTFQGGGAVAAPAAGAEALGAGAGAEAAAPITVRATLTGTDFSGEGIRNFIDRLNEEHADGYRLIID